MTTYGHTDYQLWTILREAQRNYQTAILLAACKLGSDALAAQEAAQERIQTVIDALAARG